MNESDPTQSLRDIVLQLTSTIKAAVERPAKDVCNAGILHELCNLAMEPDESRLPAAWRRMDERSEAPNSALLEIAKDHGVDCTRLTDSGGLGLDWRILVSQLKVMQGHWKAKYEEQCQLRHDADAALSDAKAELAITKTGAANFDAVVAVLDCAPTHEDAIKGISDLQHTREDRARRVAWHSNLATLLACDPNDVFNVVHDLREKNERAARAINSLGSRATALQTSLTDAQDQIARDRDLINRVLFTASRFDDKPHQLYNAIRLLAIAKEDKSAEREMSEAYDNPVDAKLIRLRAERRRIADMLGITQMGDDFVEQVEQALEARDCDVEIHDLNGALDEARAEKALQCLEIKALDEAFNKSIEDLNKADTCVGRQNKLLGEALARVADLEKLTADQALEIKGTKDEIDFWRGETRTARGETRIAKGDLALAKLLLDQRALTDEEARTLLTRHGHGNFDSDAAVAAIIAASRGEL